MSDYCATSVSIHAPVKGATVGECQSLTKQPVSIHAPVKGATRNTARAPRYQHVSIHAPVKGATEQQMQHVAR